jgi:tetratricopeptide (TPR) repeat protein
VSTARRRRQRKQQATPQAQQGARDRRSIAPVLVISSGLVLLVAIAYAMVARFGFTRFDDPTYVTENPHLVGGLTGAAIRWAFTTGYGANWHPLTWIAHLLDVQFFGFNGGAHHIVNVVLHIISTVLLFGVLARMTDARWRSAFVAAGFGLHPIHVESVAWVAERKDVLSALLWTLTLWAYVSYVRTRTARAYVAVLIAFALGLMAKPMVVTLPFALLLLDAWPLQRFSLAKPDRGSLWPLVREKLPLFGLAAASSVVTFLVQRAGGTVAVATALPFAQRMGNAALSYIAYLGKTIWPAHLAAYYPYASPVPWGRVAMNVLLIALLTVGALIARKRFPYVFVGWFWYLGTLIPAIGIVQVGTQAMADRYTYIPLIGIFLLAAWGLGDIVRWRGSLQRVSVGAAAAVIALWTVLTRAQVRHWESSMTLWTHALQVTSNNYAAHTYMGNALAVQGDLADALAHYDEAIRIRPDYAEAHNNMGPALAAEGRIDDAIAHFTEAIRLRPGYADAHSNLGVALATRGQYDQAVTQYTEALRLDPDHVRARVNLGLAYRALGRPADAMRELQTALRMSPNNEDARRAIAELSGGGEARR